MASKKTAAPAEEAEAPNIPLVAEDALPTEVWVDSAYEAFGENPEVVRAALSLADDGPYNRDEVAVAISTFMVRSVEQEG